MTSPKKDKPGATTNAGPVTTTQLTSPSQTVRYPYGIAVSGRGDHLRVT